MVLTNEIDYSFDSSIQTAHLVIVGIQSAHLVSKPRYLEANLSQYRIHPSLHSKQTLIIVCPDYRGVGDTILSSCLDYRIFSFSFTGQITDDTSLFTYPGNTGVSNFSFPDHMPVFLDELSADAIAEARRVCGNDSQCIYDFSQTGNEELAMVTMTTNEVNIMDATISCKLGFISTVQLIEMSCFLRITIKILRALNLKGFKLS